MSSIIDYQSFHAYGISTYIYLFFHFHNCFTWLFFFFTFLPAVTFTYMSEFLNYVFVTFIHVFNLFKVPMICKASYIIMCASKRHKVLPNPHVTDEVVTE